MTLEPYHLFVMSATIIGAFFGMGKLLLRQTLHSLDIRLKSIEDIKKSLTSSEENIRLLERDLLRLRADMPLHYVRREDYIRAETTILAKLDNLSEKIDGLKRN